MASKNKMEKINRRKRPTGGGWMKGGLKLRLKRAAFFNPSMRMALKEEAKGLIDEAISDMEDETT